MSLKFHFPFIFFITLASSVVVAEEAGPAEIAIGERLILETRFSQPGLVNKEDVSQRQIVTIADPMPSVFKGNGISCRSCHMVDEYADKGHNPSGGMRSYTDFARRSPRPAREDNDNLTPRNSMSMVNISKGAYSGDAEGALFHHDGEFNSMTELVKATLTGRNFGWLPGEVNIAIKHIASVVRSDNGNGELAKEFGGSYRKIFQAKDKTIPAEFRLPKAFQLDINNASDIEIVAAVAKLIAVYVTDLSFSKNENNEYDSSAYDLFLQKNNLPRRPISGETAQQYSQRLLTAVEKLSNPVFVNASEKKLTTHQSSFGFGKKELQGMTLFFRRGSDSMHGGNCVSCHSAPDFSDFKFHNTGLTRRHYESLHGAGSFDMLDIPSLKKRNKNFNRYLPATANHPRASSTYRRAVDAMKPEYVDLGLWNIFANPDVPAPQKKIRRILCEQAEKLGESCDKEQLLKLSVAAFKTPVLRDLGHSGPYFHDGQSGSLEEVMAFYRLAGKLARSGRYRYTSPEMNAIYIDDNDVISLLAFLRALNEDYE